MPQSEDQKRRWRENRERIAAMLRKDPRMSDSRVSCDSGIGRNVIRDVRRNLEEAGEIPRVYERMGIGGVPWTPT